MSLRPPAPLLDAASLAPTPSARLALVLAAGRAEPTSGVKEDLQRKAEQAAAQASFLAAAVAELRKNKEARLAFLGSQKDAVKKAFGIENGMSLDALNAKLSSLLSLLGKLSIFKTDKGKALLAQARRRLLRPVKTGATPEVEGCTWDMYVEGHHKCTKLSQAQLDLLYQRHMAEGDLFDKVWDVLMWLWRLAIIAD